MNILMLSGSSSDPASRFRLYQYREPLRHLGHKVEIRPAIPSRYWNSSLQTSGLKKIASAGGSFCRILNAFWRIRDIEKFDVVLMNRDLVPETKISFFEPWMKARNPNLIFDFDDAIYLGRRLEKIKKILPSFKKVTPGNPTLADFAEKIVPGRSRILPTVVDTDRFVPGETRGSGPFRVGWSGSLNSFSIAAPFLKRIVESLKNNSDIEFVFALEKDPGISWAGGRVRYKPWTEKDEVSIIQSFDIGIMPLEDNDFERGKCALKAIQYMACAVPAFVSPVGINRKVVDHEQNGFHCESPEDWVSFIEKVKDRSSGVLSFMGEKGREKVVREYSVHAVLDDLLDLLKEAADSSPQEVRRQAL